MLIAYNQDKKSIRAEEAEGKDSYYCRSCQNPVFLKTGTIRHPHFCHYQHSDCQQLTEAETEEHLLGKALLYRTLSKDYQVDIEYYIPSINQRPDIYVHGDSPLAIEFQCSPLSSSDLIKRTQSYWLAGIEVVWLLGKSYLPSKADLSLSLEKFIQPFSDYSFAVKYLDVAQERLVFSVFEPSLQVKGSSINKRYDAPLAYDYICAPQHLLKVKQPKRLFSFKYLRTNYEQQAQALRRSSKKAWQLNQALYQRKENITQLSPLCFIDVREEWLIKTPAFLWKLDLIRYLEGLGSGQPLDRCAFFKVIEEKVKLGQLELNASPYLSLFRKIQPILYFMQALVYLDVVSFYGDGWLVGDLASRPRHENDLVQALDSIQDSVSLSKLC